MDSRHFLPNVLTQFRSLNRSGERIGVLEGFTRDFVDKRYTVFHKKGGKNNHFQGIERIGPSPADHGQLPLFQAALGSPGLPAGLAAHRPRAVGLKPHGNRVPPPEDRW